MRSFFKKFSDGFSKTVSAIASKTAVLFGQKPIDASSLETLDSYLMAINAGQPLSPEEEAAALAE